MQDNTVKKPYRKPTVERIQIDKQISLVMMSGGTEPDPPPNPMQTPDDSEPSPIWG